MAQRYAVIMAGGSGTRFWPWSRASRPKQLLPLLGPQAMVRQTVERLFPLFPAERIFIVTARLHGEMLARSVEILPAENVIGEPVGRDTAPCVGLAATLLEWRDPGALFCCLPADHYIGDVKRFQAALERGFALAEAGRLVAFGVPPTRPETGYGYIRARDGRFHEKPDEARAREYVAKGGYYWNCGVFVWRASVILKAVARHLPEHAAALGRIGEAMGTSRLPDVLAREYGAMKRISIDYGVMEKEEGIAMVEADFGWDDVGSWLAAAEHRAKDEAGNVVEGTAALADARGNIVFAEGDHLVAGFGVEDLVIVHTKDATLVCRKDRASDLKKLVDTLKARGLERYL